MSALQGHEMMAKLRFVTESAGLHAESRSNTITATREFTLSKWFLGGRKTVYRLSCDIDEAALGVRFRESTTESSWGVPPLGFSTEVTSQSGTRVRQITTAGGERFDTGRVRDEIESAVGAAGWQFHHD